MNHKYGLSATFINLFSLHCIMSRRPKTHIIAGSHLTVKPLEQKRFVKFHLKEVITEISIDIIKVSSIDGYELNGVCSECFRKLN